LFVAIVIVSRGNAAQSRMPVVDWQKTSGKNVLTRRTLAEC